MFLLLFLSGSAVFTVSLNGLMSRDGTFKRGRIFSLNCYFSEVEFFL